MAMLFVGRDFGFTGMPLLIEIHAISQELWGSTDSFTAAVVEWIVDALTAWHESEPGEGHDAEAAEWQAKLDEINARREDLGNR